MMERDPIAELEERIALKEMKDIEEIGMCSPVSPCLLLELADGWERKAETWKEGKARLDPENNQGRAVMDAASKAMRQCAEDLRELIIENK